MGVLTVRGDNPLRSGRDRTEEASVEIVVRQEQSYSERHAGEHHNQGAQGRATAVSDWTRLRPIAQAVRVGNRGGRGGIRAATRQLGREMQKEENVASQDRPSSEVDFEETHNRREQEAAKRVSDWTPHRPAASTAALASRGGRGAHRGRGPTTTRQSQEEAQREDQGSEKPLVAVTGTDNAAVKVSASGNQDVPVAPTAYHQPGSEPQYHGPRSFTSDLLVSSTNTDKSTANASEFRNRVGRGGLHGGIATTARQSGHAEPQEGHRSVARISVNRTNSIETLSIQFSSMHLTTANVDAKKDTKGTIGGWHIPALRRTAESNVTASSSGQASAGGALMPQTGPASSSDAAEDGAIGTCADVITGQADEHHSECDAGRASNAPVENSHERAPDAMAERAEGLGSSNVEAEDKPQEASDVQQRNSRQSSTEPAELIQSIVTTTGPPVGEGNEASGLPEQSTSSWMPTIPRTLLQTTIHLDTAIKSRASSQGARAVATNILHERRRSQRLMQACNEAAEQRRVEAATAQERRADIMARHGLELSAVRPKHGPAAATLLTADREWGRQKDEEHTEDGAQSNQSNVRAAASNDEPAAQEAQTGNSPTIEAEATEGPEAPSVSPQDNEPTEKEVFFDASNEFEDGLLLDETQEPEEQHQQQPHVSGGSSADGPAVPLSPSASTVPPGSERRRDDGGVAASGMHASHTEVTIPSFDTASGNPLIAELQAQINRQIAAALQDIEQSVLRICTQALAQQSVHQCVPPPIVRRSGGGTDHTSNAVAARIQESGSDVTPEPRHEPMSVTAEVEQNLDKKDEDREASDSQRQVARVSPQPRSASEDAHTGQQSEEEGMPTTSSFARATFGYGHRFLRSQTVIADTRVRHSAENTAMGDGGPSVPSYEPLVAETVDTTNFVVSAEPAVDIDPFTMEASAAWNNPAAQRDRAGGRRNDSARGRGRRIATPQMQRHVNFAELNRVHVFDGGSNESNTGGPQRPGDDQQAIAMSGEASRATDDSGFGANAGNDNEGTPSRGEVRRAVPRRPSHAASTGEPSDAAVRVQRSHIPGFPVSRDAAVLASSDGRGGGTTARGRGVAQPRGRAVSASAHSASGTAREAQNRLQRDIGSVFGGDTSNNQPSQRSVGFGLRFRR